MKHITFFSIILLGIMSCEPVQTEYQLPILGRSEVVEKEVNGETVYDTIHHKIANFAFVNQDSIMITNDSLAGKVYVADFFFTSCPTICPVMKQQMLRVYEKYKGQPGFAILSHTIDPKHDSVAVLKDFAQKLGVSSDTWHFVTGTQDDIYDIGEKSYLVVADEDESAPGGYIHSGAFILVDGRGRIRGVYDGTVPEQVDVLINDISRLTKSKR